MKKVLLIFTLAVSLLNSKDVVIVTDISVEPSQKGKQQIEGQLERLLNFTYEGDTYLKFEDKVTMAFMDNKAENASTFFSEPTFNLSMDKFERFDDYLDNYYNNAGQYIDGVLGVNKEKILIDLKTVPQKVELPQDVLFLVDNSNSMSKFQKQISNSIKSIKESMSPRNNTIIKGSNTQLNQLLNQVPIAVNKTQLILYTDGFDDTKENILKIKEIQRNYDVKPIYLSEFWDKNYLLKLSSSNSLLNEQQVVKSINESFYQTTKSKEKIDFTKFPNVPIIESLYNLTKQSYLSPGNKKLYILSTLMQNSQNMSFEKIISNEKEPNTEEIYNFYKNLRMLPNLKGHYISVLRVNTGLFKNNNQINTITTFWKEFLLKCGAKSVSIQSDNLKEL